MHRTQRRCTPHLRRAQATGNGLRLEAVDLVVRVRELREERVDVDVARERSSYTSREHSRRMRHLIPAVGSAWRRPLALWWRQRRAIGPGAVCHAGQQLLKH